VYAISNVVVVQYIIQIGIKLFEVTQNWRKIFHLARSWIELSVSSFPGFTQVFPVYLNVFAFTQVWLKLFSFVQI